MAENGKIGRMGAGGVKNAGNAKKWVEKGCERRWKPPFAIWWENNEKYQLGVRLGVFFSAYRYAYDTVFGCF